jgi:hypothetical protein
MAESSGDECFEGLNFVSIQASSRQHSKALVPRKKDAMVFNEEVMLIIRYELIRSTGKGGGNPSPTAFICYQINISK